MSRPRKIMRLDADGNELGARVSRSGLNRNPDLQGNTNRFVAAVFVHVKAKFNLGDDLTAQMAVLRQVSSLHHCQRKKLSGTNTAYNKYMSSDISITVHEVEYKAKPADLEAVYVKAREDAGFTDETQADWLGSVTHTISLWTLFSARMEDILYTPAGISSGKDRATGTSKVRAFASLGVAPKFKALCVGAGWNPSYRSGMAGSLGAATQLCLLSMSKPDKFSNKWLKAVTNTFSHVPSIGSIAKFMLGARASENNAIVHRLCQIASLTGARNQHRIILPPMFYVNYMLEVEGDRATFSHAKAKLIDYSGKGAYRVYQHNRDTAIKTNCTDATLAQQVIYHCIFGSYTADTGVLSFMTETQEAWWTGRDKVDKTLLDQFRPSKPLSIPGKSVRVLPLSWVPKMSSATPTHLMRRDNPEGLKEAIFSGRTIRRYRESDFTRPDAWHISQDFFRARDIESYLDEVVEGIVSCIEEDNGEAVFGTTEWEPLEQYLGEAMDSGTSTHYTPPIESRRSWW